MHTTPVSPPQPHARRFRTFALVLGGCVILAAAVFGALLATGSLRLGTRHSAVRHSLRARRTPRLPANAAGATSAPSATPTSTAVVHGQTFTASYPSNWTVVGRAVHNLGVVETRLVAPNGRDFVVVDEIPGGGATDVEQQARAGMREAQHKVPGYRTIDFRPVTIGSVSGWLWTFDENKQSFNGGLASPDRAADTFFDVGSDNFAVVGGGSPGTVAPVAHQVAESIVEHRAGSG